MDSIEWSACLAGLLGAGLLALNNSYSRWGFVAFMASNLLWIIYGLENKAYGLVVMQLGFTITSTVGIINWFPCFKRSTT
jgi:hypothetical protein